MRDQVSNAPPPGYWPPRPSRFWRTALAPVRWLMLRQQARVREVEVHGLRELSAKIAPADGVFICPNHSHAADGPVMMHASSLALRPFHFMTGVTSGDHAHGEFREASDWLTKAVGTPADGIVIANNVIPGDAMWRLGRRDEAVGT